MAKKHQKNPKRTFMKVLCSILAVVLVILLGATCYVQYLMGHINRKDPGNQPTLSQEDLDALQSDETMDPEYTGEVMDPDDVDLGTADQTIGNNDNVVNIMLIGQDRRGTTGNGHSDSMILCTFNKKENSLTMTSFLRDLYVKIPGYLDNRINVAYFVGGMDKLSETLDINFGIHVDGYVEVDFSQFADIIDLLGGVDLELTWSEANFINDYCRMEQNLTPAREGMNHLVGVQALAHSRNRSSNADGDFSRTNRQRQVLEALINEFRSAKLTTLLGLMDDILPMITTDLTNSEILNYASSLFPMLSNCTLTSQRIPADGTYEGRFIRGMAVLVADMDANRQLLLDSLGEGAK